MSIESRRRQWEREALKQGLPISAAGQVEAKWKAAYRKAKPPKRVWRPTIKKAG